MLEWWFDNQWSNNEISTINFKAIGLLEVLNSHIIVQLSVFQLETTRGPRNERIWQEVSHVSRILKRWWNSHDILEIKDGNTQGKGEQILDSKDLKVYTKHEQVCVERKAIKWSKITQIIGGKGGISHHEFDWYPRRAHKIDDDHDTIVERFHEDVIGRWWHQVKWWCNESQIILEGRSK